MLKISLEQWRMFRAVAEHGGFNQASQAIFKSQSSIHNAVNKIEQSLGIKLFKVEGRKTLLNESGELMLRRAEFLLDEAARLEAVGVNLADGVETKLRIAVDEVFPPALLYKVLDQVSNQYPLLRIELIESILSGSVELLEKASVDFAISPMKLEGMYHEQLCQIEFIAVASPQHPLNAYLQEINLEDLKSHRQIVVRDSAMLKQEDEGWLEAEQRWTVSHMKTSIDMITAGLGFAWLPAPLIDSELQSGALKPLKLSTKQHRTSYLYLLFADSDRLGPVARSFLDELRSECMQLSLRHAPK